ncbi:MAG: triose-phosphate isomerase [Patescibacteria group bacterium]|nr:triose-phosphate isomerase [Patescibacteria group bacterium]
MDKKLIVANWKCNPTTFKKAELLFDLIKKGLKNIKNVEVVICPPFVYLTTINKKRETSIKTGGQDCFWKKKGPFTGEVSPDMLKDLGCRYVIIGHSERRRYFSETDTMINKKLKLTLKKKLKPILCIDKISQVKKDLKGISRGEIKNIVLAYEPLFAIGTGKTASPEKAAEFNLSIKRILGDKVLILYGGSVSSKNARGFIQESGFQGLLIGGASLRAKEFIRIVKNIDSLR